MCKKCKNCTIDNAIFNKNCTMDRAILSKPPQKRQIPLDPHNPPKVKINKDWFNIFTILKFT